MSAVAKVILGEYLGVGALRTTNAVLVRDAAGYRIVPADDAVGSGHIDRASEDHGPSPDMG